jgi:hypothetical protein
MQTGGNPVRTKKQPLPRNLTEALRRTIHESGVPLEILAEAIGKSANSLYRACIENDEICKSGATFPLQSLYGLMKASDEYCILEYLAFLSGYLLVKVPVYKARKTDDMTMLTEYQEVTTRAVSAFNAFIKNPKDPNALNALVSDLHTVMERSIEAKQYADKAFAGQTELF